MFKSKTQKHMMNSSGDKGRKFRTCDCSRRQSRALRPLDRGRLFWVVSGYTGWLNAMVRLIFFASSYECMESITIASFIYA
ncbi:Beauvericin cluster-specific repressor BEA4 [Fusarium oxysporum f. sp. albedinis]|nr:Beauvericin cluster-specific repressor BEA4 [Fusarium oxysporum f. sp. albedinis]